jgi:hypothetical protein
MDHTNFRYVPDVNNPRLLIKRPRSDNSTGVQLTEPRRKFAERILAKFPKWQCVCENGGGYKAIEVYAGAELLGGVYVRVNEFEITNPRIRGKRTRSGSMKTKDAEKALQLVRKYFKPASHKERFSQAAADIAMWAENEAQTTQTLFRSKFHAVTYAARDYVMQNLAPYIEAAKNNGLDISRYSGLDELYLRSKCAYLFMSYVQKNIGSVVKREGSGYLVGDPTGDNFVSVDDTMLPSPMRVALGKLKLAEPRTMLEGVGFKLDENTFFVLAE